MIRYTTLLLIVLAVSACAPVPVSREAPAGPGTTSTTPADDRGAEAAPSPSAVLMQQSRSHAALGEYPEAAAALERAIRIEPGNPWLWLELARVHYAAGDMRQAEAHARKASSLAGTDDAARRAADNLLAAIGG
jgi:Flp pilus assembly protein TadD